MLCLRHSIIAETGACNLIFKYTFFKIPWKVGIFDTEAKIIITHCPDSSYFGTNNVLSLVSSCLGIGVPVADALSIILPVTSTPPKRRQHMTMYGVTRNCCDANSL